MLAPVVLADQPYDDVGASPMAPSIAPMALETLGSVVVATVDSESTAAATGEVVSGMTAGATMLVVELVAVGVVATGVVVVSGWVGGVVGFVEAVTFAPVTVSPPPAA